MRESVHAWIIENDLCSDDVEHVRLVVEYLQDRTHPVYGEEVFEALAIKQEVESGDYRIFRGNAETSTNFGPMTELVCDSRFFGPDHHGWYVCFLGDQDRTILFGGGNLVWRACQQEALAGSRLVQDVYESVLGDFFVRSWKFTFRNGGASDSVLAVSDCRTRWRINWRYLATLTLGGNRDQP